MDLNKLYFDHQIATSRAEVAGSADCREAHREDAAELAIKIGKIQRSLGAAASAAWTALGSAEVLRERAAREPAASQPS